MTGLQIGIVVIGRNEGERLVACLSSLGPLVRRTVYVDSNSSDGSVAAARALGALVTVLDPQQPFTAARARNAGFAALEASFPDTALIQFIDGDCVLDEGWLGHAEAFLDAHPDVAVVCGRRRERFPEQSIYNQLCDREWDTPVGEALACGGDIMVRRSAFTAVGGYNDQLVAGEEPEMCVRLRQAQWRIWRLDAEMTLHDANIMHFGQWWRRSIRAGHAFAEVSALHAATPQGIWKRETQRVLLWGLALPLAILLAAVLIHPACLLLLLVYPLQIARLARRGDGWWPAFFLVAGKFPELQGALRFYANRLLQRTGGLIEYK